MELLGRIVRLQLQPASLKVGGKPERYDPTPLCVAPRLTLGPGGVIGWTEHGEPIDDVHNRTHPDSKNRGGANGISIGFTAHYEAMRARFGAHLSNGIAGENILVATERVVGEAEVASGLMIVAADGGRIRLSEAQAAEPCVPYTRFALRLPPQAREPATLKEALAFLRGGTRGYYARCADVRADVRLGDAVYLP